jgi:hypothetical protein
MSLNLHGQVLDLPIWHPNPRQAGPKSSGQPAPLVPTLHSDRGPVLPHGPWVRGISLHLEASSLSTFNASDRGVPYYTQGMYRLLSGRASMNDRSVRYRCERLCLCAARMGSAIITYPVQD